MENKESLLETLFEKFEAYAKTSLDLLRLKTISKITDAVLSIVSKLIFFIALLFVTILLSIGLSLWIGEIIGKSYLGFFIVAAFYVLVAFILHYFPNVVKSQVKDAIIVNMLNNQKDEKELA